MSVFDAYSAYYDLLYRDKDYGGETRFVVDALRRLGVERGDILELGCGTGRHAEHLAAAGYRVHGVDLSPSMVERAQARVGASGDRLSFEVGDVRCVRTDRIFDAVVSLFHVASYQTGNGDLDDMFRTATAHLQPGGVFLFDFWYGPGVLTDRPAVRLKELSDAHVDILRIAQPTLLPNENRVDVDYTVLVTRRSDGTLHRIRETHRMRYLFMPEIERLARDNGMVVRRACAEMSERPLGFDAWTGTVVATKT
jgi:SAM-dependent methyltransferase